MSEPPTSEPPTSEGTEVRFTSCGETLVGSLYLPGGTGPFPAVVLGGGWCYVKELALPHYATRLAASGVAALTFDYRTMGESTGEPRQHIDPWAQIEDYRNALSFLEDDPNVDSSRLGAWGISYSGGHVLIMGALDDRVRAVCSIVPVVDGYENMRLAHGTLGFRRLQAALREARRKRFATGEDAYLPHQPGSEGELATWPFPQSRITFERLASTVARRYEGRATAESTEMLLAYDVSPYLGRLGSKQTLMVVASGDDHTHWDLALRAFDRIGGNRKDLHVVPEASHLTLYEEASTIGEVAGAIGRWFADRLS